MIYRVEPWAGGWGVFEDGKKKVVEPLRTQGDAVLHAKELAGRSRGGSQIAVYAEDGRLISEFFYQQDERSALRGTDDVPSMAASAPATAKRT
jgi:Uncharacterized protein conserved in bacteria (DUF2188)